MFRFCVLLAHISEPERLHGEEEFISLKVEKENCEPQFENEQVKPNSKFPPSYQWRFVVAMEDIDEVCDG